VRKVVRRENLAGNLVQPHQKGILIGLPEKGDEILPSKNLEKIRRGVPEPRENDLLTIKQRAIIERRSHMLGGEKKNKEKRKLSSTPKDKKKRATENVELRQELGGNPHRVLSSRVLVVERG